MSCFRYTLAWGNPHTECLGPRVLLTLESDRSTIPPEILELWQPGTGYSVFCQPLAQRPSRRWSPRAKARVRRLNLERRLRRKYPLFADDFYQSQIAARPEYYFAPEERPQESPRGRRGLDPDSF